MATGADTIQSTLLTNNTNQIHSNRDYGERTEVGETRPGPARPHDPAPRAARRGPYPASG